MRIGNDLKQSLLEAQDFLSEGQDSLAIRAYKKVLEQAKKNDDEEYVALNMLGQAYDDLSEPAKAIEYFKDSAVLAKKLYGDKTIQHAVAVGNQGQVHCNEDKYREGEQLLDAAIELVKASKKLSISKLPDFFRPAPVTLYSNAADCKAQLGKMDEALFLAREAHRLAKEILPVSHSVRIQVALELSLFLSVAGKPREEDALKNEVAEGMLQAGCNPMVVMQALAQAFSAMMPSKVESNERPKSKVGRANSKTNSASNVVPLFHHHAADADDLEKNGSESRETSADCKGLQLKISLKRVKPPIWRRVVVPTNFSLADLHNLIQSAMGWTDSHLHEFQIGRFCFGDTTHDGRAKDERKHELTDFDFTVGTKFEYMYDFGDGWEHSIQVEKLLNETEYEASEMFVTGKGGCPPEDCGGPYGFMHLLHALKDPQFNREELDEWLQEYDPELLPDYFPAKKKASVKVKKDPVRSAKQLTV